MAPLLRPGASNGRECPADSDVSPFVRVAQWLLYGREAT